MGEWTAWMYDGFTLRLPTPASLCECPGREPVAWFKFGAWHDITTYGTYHAVAPAPWFWADASSECSLRNEVACHEFVVDYLISPEAYLATHAADAPPVTVVIENGPCPQ